MNKSSSPTTLRRKLFSLPGMMAALFCGAGLVELGRCVLLVAYHFPAGMTGDGILYFAMGRGLLNGLRMYVDLFETKPPIVFWLSALSLAATGGDWLYRMIHAVGLVAIPFLFALVVDRIGPPRDRAARLSIAGLAFLFGSAIASFAVGRSLGYQTEGFGIVPAIVAIVLLADRRPRAWRIPAIAACVAAAVLLKEPFALAILGGFLLVSRSRDQVVTAAKSIGLAIVLWLAILFLTGSLHGYLTVYAPEMIHGRVIQVETYHDYSVDAFLTAPAPLALRGLDIIRLVREMWASPVRGIPAFPLLALAIVLLFVLRETLAPADDHAGGWNVMAASTLVCFGYLAELVFVLEQIVALLHFQVPFQDSFFQGQCLKLACLFLLCIGQLAILARYAPRAALRVGLSCVALYVASLAVATGGDFAPHHFLFAVPVYAGAFVSFAQGLPDHRWGLNGAWLVGLLLVFNAMYPFRYDLASMDAARDAAVNGNAVVVSEARKLDTLLDACGQRRYFWVGDGIAALQGYTRHSPYQLSYGLLRADAQQSAIFGNGQANPYFHAKLLEDFLQTGVVVMPAPDAGTFPYDELKEAFKNQFSSNAPSCAKALVPINGLTVFFR